MITDVVKSDALKLKIYGSRGSIPFFNRNSVRYGGNTACVTLETASGVVVMDCGSGLMGFMGDILKRGGAGDIFILLSHLHIDHIIGLSTFSPLWDKHRTIKIFTKSRDARPLGEQVFGIFKPPYWPLDLEKASQAELIEIQDSETFYPCPGIAVATRLAAHQNETTSFRVQIGGRSVVYLLDYEIKMDTDYAGLVTFCSKADVVIFDATYTPEEYEQRRGWGHSTLQDGIALAQASGCKKMILSHMSQGYEDEALTALAADLDGGKFVFAYDGLELNL